MTDLGTPASRALDPADPRVASEPVAVPEPVEGLRDEVVPVEIKSRKGVELFAQDDHMRPDSTLEGLARLPAAFSKNGCVTAGNASGIVDGGAALVGDCEDGNETAAVVHRHHVQESVVGPDPEALRDVVRAPERCFVGNDRALWVGGRARGEHDVRVVRVRRLDRDCSGRRADKRFRVREDEP